MKSKYDLFLHAGKILIKWESELELELE